MTATQQIKINPLDINAPAKPKSASTVADRALKMSAQFWFVIAVAGQWLFAAYVIAFYGVATLHGNLAEWNKVLPHGYVAGDNMGNVVVGIHLLLAVIVTVGGPLQLIPQIRSRAPTFHRWNGRVYLLTAVVTGIVGVYMFTTRGSVGGPIQHLGIGINAALIIFCAAMALRFALARKFDIHRRWALRLFLVANGVWFFRIGLMFWIVVNQGPVGFDPKTFQGPFLSFLSIAQYALPLTVLELYLRARDGAPAGGKLAMSAGLVVLTIAMGAGIAAAAMFMWLPRI